MRNDHRQLLDRREVLKSSAAALGGSLLMGETIDAYPKGVNTNSRPSDLKITDLRVATIVKPGPSPCPLIRIDTNQGVSGRGKLRDKIRIYADTEESKDPKIYAQRMKERKERMGLTWLKMDLGVEMVADTPGTVTNPSDLNQWQMNQLPHPFLATEVTNKGIAMLEQYVAAVRDAVGMEVPLSMDHLGHLGVKSIIRLGKAYEKYNLSWMEDVIPWTYTDLLKQISEESPTPILTGEDIYLKEPFHVLCEKHAVSKIHPDLATSGGILETHKIGDMAQEYGVPMALHFAGTPV